jgi:transcriptional regulator with PAS, ATPase and Fis domain
MKIGFLNYAFNSSEFDVINLKDLSELNKCNEVNYIFIYEKNINAFSETLKKLLRFNSSIKFIPIIDSVNFNLIPSLMSVGAITFVLPPFEENINKNLKNILKISKTPDLSLETKNIFQGIVGASSKIKQIFKLINKVAQSDSTVLITGESGTGKELVAKAIYKMSKRNNKLFIPINCGAIPEDLMESELFGYHKGAFTGASTNKIGKIQAANEGTLFLDEIGEMPINLQVKILRLLQEREVQPVGANKPVKVDIRIIAATNKNLEQLVKEKKFREDLFYRLNVIPIHIPPLRERKEDISLLVDYFFKKFIKKYDKENELDNFSDEAVMLLENYSWPGNVRELENVIERIVVLKEGGSVLPYDLPSKFFQSEFLDDIDIAPSNDKEYLNSLIKLSDEGINLKEVIENLETNLIMQALERAGGVKEKAAKLLNIKRTTLIEKLKRKNLM